MIGVLVQHASIVLVGHKLLVEFFLYDGGWGSDTLCLWRWYNVLSSSACRWLACRASVDLIPLCVVLRSLSSLATSVIHALVPSLTRQSPCTALTYKSVLAGSVVVPPANHR